MKKYFLILALMVLSFSSHALYLSRCHNYGSGVSFAFESCINRNFRDVDREIGSFSYNCYNAGDEVSFSFESCINNNFRGAERKLNIALSYCSNYPRGTVSYSFESCINRNFSRIETAVRD